MAESRHTRVRDLITHRLAIVVVTALVFIGASAVSVNLYQLNKQREFAYLHDQVLQQASVIRANLEHEINTSLNLTLGLVIYISTHPDITQHEFSVIARRIVQKAPYIKNVGLARDNVISHIYPLAGNEAALGIRYLDLPDQREAVLRAINTRSTVIAGPVRLVQGGTGLISRIPIFLDNRAEDYWGIASLVIDAEAFYQRVGISSGVTGNLNIALRGKDSLGDQGEVFYGDGELFERPDSVLLPIAWPEGSWVLAAEPHQGWVLYNSGSFEILMLGISVSVFISMLVYALLDALVALSQAKRRAEASSEQKSRFFGHMTHELRTPLTAIQGVLGILQSDRVELDKAQVRELLGNADRNCSRLLWVINDVLDLKKLESGGMQLSVEPVAVMGLVRDAIDELKHIADQYQISLRIEQSVDDGVQVSGDRQRLGQVVANLLGNAIKYSPEGSVVRVNVLKIPEAVRLEVIDQGEGVSADKLDSIFEEFVQDKASRKDKIASTGLGLSISKKIIEQHQGRIGCRNLEAGGCCFYAELPIL